MHVFTLNATTQSTRVNVSSDKYRLPLPTCECSEYIHHPGSCQSVAISSVTAACGGNINC